MSEPIAFMKGEDVRRCETSETSVNVSSVRMMYEDGDESVPLHTEDQLTAKDAEIDDLKVWRVGAVAVIERAQNAINWYRETHPESDSGADDEWMEESEALLLSAAKAAPQDRGLEHLKGQLPALEHSQDG